MPASALAAAADLLLASRCAGCGAGGAWFCVVCRDSADPLRRTGPAGLRIAAAGEHEGPLRDAIHRLKYGDEPGLGRELGALVAALAAADLARGARLDALVPVPLHRSRERARGYDQAAALAAAVATATGVPLRPALRRLRGGPAQATLGRLERLRNIQGAFAGLAGSLRGLHVALVDDVATTGATLADAASAARACGARSVRAYVVAIEL